MYEMAAINAFTTGGSAFHKGLMFLWKLAWDSSIRLPYLIIVGFMILDIRLTVEIDIDVDVHSVGDDSSSEDESVSESSESSEHLCPHHLAHRNQSISHNQ